MKHKRFSPDIDQKYRPRNYVARFSYPRLSTRPEIKVKGTSKNQPQTPAADGDD